MTRIDFFFLKQKTAYEMRISDWSSDVCSSDLFDRATWAELRELFGSDGVLCLRDTLVADLPTQRARLAEALRDHDLAAFKRLAHTLRGVSLQLGANAHAAQWLYADKHATNDAAGVFNPGVGLLERPAVLVKRRNGREY